MRVPEAVPAADRLPAEAEERILLPAEAAVAVPHRHPAAEADRSLPLDMASAGLLPVRMSRILEAVSRRLCLEAAMPEAMRPRK